MMTMIAMINFRHYNESLLLFYSYFMVCWSLFKSFLLILGLQRIKDFEIPVSNFRLLSHAILQSTSHHSRLKKLDFILAYKIFLPFFGVVKTKPSKFAMSTIFGRLLFKYEEAVFSLRLIWTFNFIIS